MSEIAVPELDARVHTQVMGLPLEQKCEAGDTIDYDGDYMCLIVVLLRTIGKRERAT
jgi:hypothetical protein